MIDELRLRFRLVADEVLAAYLSDAAAVSTERLVPPAVESRGVDLEVSLQLFAVQFDRHRGTRQNARETLVPPRPEARCSDKLPAMRMHVRHAGGTLSRSRHDLPAKPLNHLRDRRVAQYADARDTICYIDRDWWDTCSSEVFVVRSVHPRGNPIIHSTNSGLRTPPITSANCGVCPLSLRPAPLRTSLAHGVGRLHSRTEWFPCFTVSIVLVFHRRESDAVTVGNNPDSVAYVWGTNGRSWYAMPLRVIPDLGQRSEYDIQPSNSERCHVLHEHEPWLQLCNHAKHFEDETAPLSVDSGA